MSFDWHKIAPAPGKGDIEKFCYFVEVRYEAFYNDKGWVSQQRKAICGGIELYRNTKTKEQWGDGSFTPMNLEVLHYNIPIRNVRLIDKTWKEIEDEIDEKVELLERLSKTK